MTRVPVRPAARSRRGAAIVEFTFVAFTLCIVMFAAFEFDRLVLVYTTISNSARAGARYAIVHGSSRTGGGVNGPSGPVSAPEVENVVRNFASAGLLDSSRVNVTVTYFGSPPTNSPGSRVRVTAVYPYDPFTVILPVRINLSATSEGIIAF